MMVSHQSFDERRVEPDVLGVGAGNTNTWQSSEELDAALSRPTTEDQARLLANLALQAGRRSSLQAAERYLDPGELRVLFGGSIAVEVASVSTFLSDKISAHTFAIASIGMAAGMGEWVHSARQRSKGEPSVMDIEGGYSLQCLKLEAGDNKAVAVAIHPREYPYGQEEPATLGKQRLIDALEIVAEAQKSGSELGPVIVPGSVARRAGLNQGGRSYAATVESMVGHRHVVPYGQDETAMLLDASAAGHIVNRLKEGSRRTGQVLRELSCRFPNAAPALRIENEALHGVLLGLLRQTAGLNDSRIVRLEREDLNHGTVSRQKHDTLTTIIVGPDSYNPRLLTAVVGSETVDSSRTLRGMTSVETAALLAGEIGTDRAGDFTLIRVALDAAEASQRAALAGKLSDAQAVTDAVPLGDTPDSITAAPVPRAGVRLRALGRIAASAAIINAAIFGVGAPKEAQFLGIGSPKPAMTKGGPEPAGIYKIKNHGLGQQSAYWSQTTSYTYNSEWVDKLEVHDVPASRIDVPGNLTDPTSPHLTVETISRRQVLDLPVQEGTGLGAVRAEDADGEPVDVAVMRDTDGQLSAEADVNPGDIYHLWYDLVDSNTPVIAASQPLAIAEGTTIGGDSLAAFKDRSIKEAASAVSREFIYDDSQTIKDRLDGLDNPGEYVAEVWSSGRCQCEQCNTLVAMVESRIHPKARLAHVSGYLKQDLKDNDYLGTVGHAWLAHQDKIVDATAHTLDEASIPSPKDDIVQLNRLWTDNQRIMEAEAPRHLPIPWLLGGMAAGGLALLERRFGTTRRALRNMASEIIWSPALRLGGDTLGPKEALGLLAWHAFGGPETMPTGNQSEHTPVPNRDNIPASSLKEVAAGRFRGAEQLSPARRRALARAAQGVLFDRRYS